MMQNRGIMVVYVLEQPVPCWSSLIYKAKPHIQFGSPTCFTLLFLQNHQRPDLLGILSLTHASSIACHSTQIVNQIEIDI